MNDHNNSGLLRRVGAALRRAILGKSSHEYIGRFTGNDEYWDRVIAAQAGWPQVQPPKPAVERQMMPIPNSADVEVRPVSRVPAQTNE
jgi:hypothetical protein